MQILDAINEMIGYLGESPIDGTDPDYEAHPMYESALRILTSTSRAVQSRGWWFNTRATTLEPVADEIVIDGDTILSVAVKRLYQEDYAVRDGKLYDLTNDTDTIEVSLEAVIREFVSFEDLPETAAEYIKLKAAERFVKTYDGDNAKLASVKEDAASAFVPFHADHIRNSAVNLFATASMSPILATHWYQRYRQR